MKYIFCHLLCIFIVNETMQFRPEVKSGFTDYVQPLNTSIVPNRQIELALQIQETLCTMSLVIPTYYYIISVQNRKNRGYLQLFVGRSHSRVLLQLPPRNTAQITRQILRLYNIKWDCRDAIGFYCARRGINLLFHVRQ